MQKRNFFHNILSLLCLMALGSCGDLTGEFSRRPCRVIIENINDPTLGSALNPMVSGVFCMIEMTHKGGAAHYHCTSNQGLTSDIPWTELDKRRNPIMGLNNGIIVGHGSLDQTFFAYDRECPNCFDPDAIPIKSKPLRMNNIGRAICDICKREYDMNNRGIVVKGEAGNKLTRFRASTTGPHGALIVQ